jgi:hypothetical protein
MKRPIAGSLTALSVAFATVGTMAALAVASDGAGAESTRHTYVVGGEVVHPPAPRALDGSDREPSSTAGPAGSTRYGYVVAGELIVPGR